MTEPAAETPPRPPAIINAVIRDASIGLDAGASSLVLEVVLDVSEKISAMRYAVTGLYTLEPLKTRQDNGNLAGHSIFRLLQVSGATRLAEAVGRTVRLRVRGNDILAIGHPVREVWWAPVAEGQQIEARGAVKMLEAAEAERALQEIADELGEDDGAPIMDGMATMDGAPAERELTVSDLWTPPSYLDERARLMTEEDAALFRAAEELPS